MQNAGDVFDEIVVKTLQNAYGSIFEYGSKAFFALLILGIGWICALLLRKASSKLLKALGFDVLSERVGLKGVLEKGGIKRSPSALIGFAFYWLILLSTLVMVFNALNLEIASLLLRQSVLYVPKIIVALVLLSLGSFLSHFVARFVESTSRVANVPFPETLAKIAGYAIIGMAAMMALETLSIATEIVTWTFVIIFGVVPVLAGLLLLIAGRDLVGDVLAGKTIGMDFKVGDRIKMEGIVGEITSIDATTTKIKTEEEMVVVPNSLISRNLVRKVS